MHRVLCSTGTMLGRANGRDYRLLLSLEKEIRCDGLELLFYDSWYDQIDALHHVINRLSLPVCTFHVEKNICGGLICPETAAAALDKFRLNCQFAASLGAEKLVYHLWDGRMDDAAVEACLSHYPVLSKIAGETGLALTIENIITAQHHPLHYFHRLLDLDPGVLFTYDTKCAAFHQQEDALFLPQHGPLAHQLAHLHINDYNGGYRDLQNFKTLHIGDGHVDFERFFARLKALSYAGDFTMEATSFDKDGIIHADRINATCQIIRQLIQ